MTISPELRKIYQQNLERLKAQQAELAKLKANIAELHEQSRQLETEITLNKKTTDAMGQFLKAPLDATLSEEDYENSPDYPTLTSIIREILSTFGTNEFTVGDIADAINTRNITVNIKDINKLRTRISNTLRIMKGDGKLALVSSGKGKDPHVYRCIKF